jgi:O-antigen/teichoic acid export membrane protein
VFNRLQQFLRHLVIYGLGDAASSLVSFLLLPIYTRYLTPRDYGVITLLLTIEAVTRILFRWGTDGAFMRLFYDSDKPRDQQTLASTILLFLVGINGLLLAVGLVVTPWLGEYLFEGRAYNGLVRLVIFNTFLTTFHFIPNSVLRIREQSRQFAALTFAKSLGTILVRLVLVVPLRMGVLGVVLADTVVTITFTVILAKYVTPLLRPLFSRAVLAEALRFGLPRLPHAIAAQTIAVSDRYLMAMFLPLREIGLYGIGSSFGQALKLFLNGFEFAWAPFYFGAMRRADARQIYSRLGTYVFAAVVFLAAGLSAVASDLVRLMAAPEFGQASVVIPWMAVGVVAQAGYQVSALGLNITKQTKYFPIATSIAAAVSIASNLILIPRFGFIGAAWANAISYWVLTLAAGWFAYRVYPIRYEWRRLGLVAASGLASFGTALLVVPSLRNPIAGMLARGAVVAVLYPLALWGGGFLERTEIDRLVMLWRSIRAMKAVQAVPDESTEMGGEIVGDLSGGLASDPKNQTNHEESR